MLNTRITRYQSEAYNLPSDVIYYVGPALACRGAQEDAESCIRSAIGEACPDAGYMFCALEVSADSLSAFLALRPDISAQDRLRLQALTADSGGLLQSAAGRRTLAARIDTDSNDGYTFLEADITGCSDEDTVAAVVQYAEALYRHERGCLPEPPADYVFGAAKYSLSVDYDEPEEDAGSEDRSECCAPEMNAACGSSFLRKAAVRQEKRVPAFVSGGVKSGSAAARSGVDALLEELERRLAAIPQSEGVNILLQRHFEDFFRSLETLSPRPLSPLQIDRDLHILLPGYDLEIQMLPVWKAVYILFLRHEEGIVLNRMPDYRDEFGRIYRSFASGEPCSIEATIEEVTTPGSDVFRQYKSKINSAFRQVLAEDLAEHYIIGGSRNAPYRIQLPRDKVTIGFAVPEPLY
jgi:hypothetical protein